MAALLYTSTGQTITARWDTGNVKVAIDDGAEFTAFALTDESGLYLAEAPDGSVVIVYQIADGTLHRKFSFTESRTVWEDE